MALKINELSVLAYANKFTMWHYTTIDASVIAAGYFDGGANMLRVNDLIIANLDTDGVPDTTFYIVTANTGSAVTIAAYA
jgi:hypothetical protein|tara:strand:+ start:196456 stop:196695 length:240 start_codon:yes stop_codon:yes gene_type:complete